MKNKPQLFTCLSPALVHLYDLKETIAVVIDIFRATSTICTALDNGAARIIPVATVEECLQLENSRPDIITAGERDGKVIKGLQGGNSPLEYPSEIVTGKTLALTTTNGTRLLHMVKNADEVVIGSFLNLDALCNYLVENNKNVLLACGGWRDKVNLEDSLFAGAVIQKIRSHFNIECDSSLIVQSMYEEARKSGSILDYLKSGSHYRRLAGYNLYEDMAYCCSLNIHPIVPVYKAPFLLPLGAAMPALAN